MHCMQQNDKNSNSHAKNTIKSANFNPTDNNPLLIQKTHVNDYKILETISHKDNTTVYKAKNKAGEEVAVKEFNREETEKQKNVRDRRRLTVFMLVN